MEYISGFGISRIEAVDGAKYDPDELQRHAGSLSLLLDYYIFPGAGKQIGERWDVFAEEVSSLSGFDAEADVKGELTLERLQNRERPTQGTEAVLKIVKGHVHLSGRGTRKGQTATVTSRAGIVYYSPEQLLVREARITWNARTAWISQGHLLFGTEQIRDLKTESYYEASLVSPEEQ